MARSRSSQQYHEYLYITLCKQNQYCVGTCKSCVHMWLSISRRGALFAVRESKGFAPILNPIHNKHFKRIASKVGESVGCYITGTNRKPDTRICLLHLGVFAPENNPSIAVVFINTLRAPIKSSSTAFFTSELEATVLRVLQSVPIVDNILEYIKNCELDVGIHIFP